MARSRTKEPSSLSVLIRIPVVRRLWIAISVSSFGDWLGLLATTALAAYLTRDATGLAQGAAISGVLLTRLLPDLILGPVAGALVDRFDRRTIAVICDVSAALLYASIAFAGNLVWLLVAQFLVEAIGLFSNPSKQAIWVSIVPRERLAVANQLNYVSIYGMVPVAAAVFALLATVAQFFGATTAAGATGTGALISGPSSPAAIEIALYLDAATYLFAAATIFLSRRLIPDTRDHSEQPKSILTLIKEGVSFIRHSPVMRALYIGILGAFGAGGLTAGVAQAYVSALGAGNAGYGILFGSVFTGLALGMLIGPKVLPSVPRRMVFSASIGLAGVVLLLMGVLQDFLGATIAAAVMGMFAGIAWITGFTMIGHEVADHLRGRVFAFVTSSVRIMLLATIAVGPVVAGLIRPLHVEVGEFSWNLSSAGIVLIGGGVVALLVSVYAGRQTGGVLALVFARLRGRRDGMFVTPADLAGPLIAVEGADSAARQQCAAAISGHLRAAGWVVLDQEPVDHDGHPASVPAVLRTLAVLAQRFTEQVRPALTNGITVVWPGAVDAVPARHGDLGEMGEDRIQRMTDWAIGGLWPDLTVLLDVTAPVPLEAASLAGAAAEAAAVASAVEPDLLALDTGDVADVDPAELTQALRDRAALAPERYLVLARFEAGVLPPVLVERLDSVMRTRRPVKVEVETRVEAPQ